MTIGVTDKKIDLHGFHMDAGVQGFDGISTDTEIVLDSDAVIQDSTISKATSSADLYLHNSSFKEVSAKNAYITASCSVESVTCTEDLWLERPKDPVLVRLPKIKARNFQLVVLKDKTVKHWVVLKNTSVESLGAETPEGVSVEYVLQGSTVFTGTVTGATVIDERGKEAAEKKTGED